MILPYCITFSATNWHCLICFPFQWVFLVCDWASGKHSVKGAKIHCLSSRRVWLSQARAERGVCVSRPGRRVLCGRRDVEHWLMYTVHLPQRPRAVRDRSVSSSALPESNQNTGLLLPALPRYDFPQPLLCTISVLLHVFLRGQKEILIPPCAGPSHFHSY